MSAQTIDVAGLRTLLAGDTEYALVDVREEGVQARDGHILVSVPLPFSRLEQRIALLVPRSGTRLVVTDGGDGALAQRAAARLEALGYRNVAVLEGGVAAWRAAGNETFTGSSAYSKAFGEFVEQHYGTPHLSAEDLKRKLDDGEDVVVLDGRTVQEFRNFSIPGAHAVPNAELPYRVHDLVRSAETLVVVNCAGRTRSIIGAQALINAGLPNPVQALENGTMAWLFQGWDLDHGVGELAPAPTAAGLEKARAVVGHLRARYGLAFIDRDTLDQFRAERGRRTLHLYDVRTQGEFEAGHLPDAHWAEGGQLVQGIDRWVGTRNGRIVVVDDADAVRAAITASWLVQLGWGEVFVFAADPATDFAATGPDTPPLPVTPPEVTTVEPAALTRLLADGAVLLDLDTSLAYRAGHIPGARFAVRSRLDPARLPGAGTIVLTSPDGVLARLAAADLGLATARPVVVLAGGTAAWRAAGLPLETGDTALLHDTDDVWRSPYQVDGDRHEAFREYLDWEIALADQLKRDDTARFRIFPKD
ncbi:rhodanese-like domain-containing protein [Zavarzinia sp. CC-PAN008]|uniref:rhodanese-like domain-containing protein n=1 Tax=Zavarzinia sp. CC-PAN008 TaxID=3243332 RepID=UPI003F746793